MMRLANSSEGKKKSKARNYKEGKEYMNSEHEFELCINLEKQVNNMGYEGTGIVRTMIGREAKLKNAINVIDFGSGKVKKLMFWRAK